MNYLTYSGNNIINAKLPDTADILYSRDRLPGLSKREVPGKALEAFRKPVDMPPLQEQVDASSKILIAFDDNCQPFPPTVKPDIRQQVLEVLIPELYSYGVKKENISILCAIALHRKMKRHELEAMVGPKIMKEFYPQQLENFDAEDRDRITVLEDTEEGEPVEVWKDALECDLIIYVDTVQIPLNGGHKSVAVGMGTYNSIANHHHPKMTSECPHVMQPDGSRMHSCIERISKVIQKHTKIMVMEAAMNNSIYPGHLRFLGKPDSRCNIFEKALKTLTPASMLLLPEPVRRKILVGMKTVYEPTEINVGTIDGVHKKTLAAMKEQLWHDVPKQYDSVVFGLPDISPYAIDARLNPVLVLSDVLGYIFNWFYNKPLVKKGGVVIILNPAMETFHPEYHVAYKKFYDEVLVETKDPFEMQQNFQEKFARDPHLIDCYRNKWAHHGFHPFTVWYWATYAVKYLSKTILVGPSDDKVAKRLGIEWAPSMDHALDMAKEASGGPDVVALTMPPFFYVNITG